LRGFASRVAISNYRGSPLLECYVVPTMAVTDYRTSTTGITPAHLSSRRSIHTLAVLGPRLILPLPKTLFAKKKKADAEKFPDVQRRVADIIKDKVLIGHSLWNDLSGT